MYCSKAKHNNRQMTLLRGNLLIIHQSVSGETCHETYFLRFYQPLIGYDQQRTVFAHEQPTFIDELLLKLFYEVVLYRDVDRKSTGPVTAISNDLIGSFQYIRPHDPSHNLY